MFPGIVRFIAITTLPTAITLINVATIIIPGATKNAGLTVTVVTAVITIMLNVQVQMDHMTWIRSD